MPNLNSLKQIIKPELDKFEKYFSSVMKTDRGLLNLVLRYVLKTKGKQLRPILVFYSAKLAGEPTEKTYVAASLVELLHTATLIHDDVVDNSQLRRGFFSIKALWKSKIAVLVGDYLLSRGLLLAVENNAYEILEIVSDAVRLMAEGELLQLEKARHLDISEDLYFDIIEKKTATLISASTMAGYRSVSENNDNLLKIKELGKFIGIAFQIKDDLFDYQASQSVIGKPIGNDIAEKKITLPLIYALNNLSQKEKRAVLRKISKGNLSKSDISEIISIVKTSGGVEKAVAKMHYYRDRAIRILEENFPDSPIKENFAGLINFIVERNK